MSTETNKATARRGIEEGWNQGKVALFDELHAPNFVNHDPDSPDVRTQEDYKRYVTETRSAFPDLHFTIDDMIAEGDKVSIRYTFRGTNTGDIMLPTMRIPATGKQITMTGILIACFAEGRAVELWNQPDYLSMLQQLGLIPGPSPVG